MGKQPVVKGEGWSGRRVGAEGGRCKSCALDRRRWSLDGELKDGKRYSKQCRRRIFRWRSACRRCDVPGGVNNVVVRGPFDTASREASYRKKPRGRSGVARTARLGAGGRAEAGDVVVVGRPAPLTLPTWIARPSRGFVGDVAGSMGRTNSAGCFHQDSGRSSPCAGMALSPIGEGACYHGQPCGRGAPRKIPAALAGSGHTCTLHLPRTAQIQTNTAAASM